jgi:hypothetical protein
MNFRDRILPDFGIIQPSLAGLNLFADGTQDCVLG